MLNNCLIVGHLFLFFKKNIIMEFKKGSIVVTKDGEYVIKKMMTLYNAVSLKPVTIFIVDDNGNERSVEENQVISVKNNHVENIEEP
jgi:hypothetical protein